MAVDGDKIVSDYLQRVELELEGVSTARRRELLTDLREHIETERADMAGGSAADVLTIINRLGDPARIAAAARDDGEAAVEADRFAQSRGRAVAWVRAYWRILLVVILVLIVALVVVGALFFTGTASGTALPASQGGGGLSR